MNSEIETLQTHVAFQEHTIAELNVALINQQKQLDAFRRELQGLRHKLELLELQRDYQGQNADEEKPPHY